MKIKSNNKQGISLIVLVISIIVMIILAGAIIISVNNTGILSSADKAKLDTEIANEKEILNLCVVNAKVQDEKRELTVEGLNKELVQYNAKAFMEIDTIIVQFIKSNRYYTVDSEGKAENAQSSGLKTLTLVCKKTDGTVLYTKEYTIITDKYAVELPVVEGYEPIDLVATGTITESTTVEIPYYVILDDDTELVFTGLDSSGNVTTVESDIVSYMVGDGSATLGNGVKDKINYGILNVPATYKDKSVVKIGQFAVGGCMNIKKADLGDKTESIGVQVFVGCSQLEGVILGKNLKTIGNAAFYECPKLKTVIVKTETIGVTFNQFLECNNFKEVKVSEDNPIYKVEDNILYSKDGKILYMVPTGMGGTLTIKQGVETIYNRAFGANNLLQEVIVSNTVKTIKDHAFEVCNIKKIDLGEKTESIGVQVFVGCPQLEEVILGKNLTTIGDFAFMKCPKLKTVIVKTETSGVAFNQFLECNNFKEIKVSENNPTYKVEDNILYSKDGKTLYMVPTGMGGTLTIKHGVEIIYNTALAQNSLLQEVIFSDTVKTIGNYAFGDSGIKNIELDGIIESLGETSFRNCTKLEEVILGENLKSVGAYAFLNCSKLKTVIIDSLTIAKALTSQTSADYLVNYATTIYIKEGITEIGNYVTTNFDKVETDKTGYAKYEKKTT